MADSNTNGRQIKTQRNVFDEYLASELQNNPHMIALDKALDSVKQQRKILESKISEMTSELNAIGNLGGAIDSLSDEISAIQDELTRISADKAQKTAEIDEAKRKIAEYDRIAASVNAGVNVSSLSNIERQLLMTFDKAKEMSTIKSIEDKIAELEHLETLKSDEITKKTDRQQRYSNMLWESEMASKDERDRIDELRDRLSGLNDEMERYNDIKDRLDNNETVTYDDFDFYSNFDEDENQRKQRNTIDWIRHYQEVADKKSKGYLEDKAFEIQDKINGYKAKSKELTSEELFIEYQKYDIQEKQRRLVQSEIKDKMGLLTIEEKTSKYLEKMGVDTEKIRGHVDLIARGWGQIRSGANQAIGAISDIFKPLAELDKYTTELSRNLGLSPQHLNSFRKTLQGIMQDRNLALKYGVYYEDLTEVQGKSTEEIGRSLEFGGETGEDVAASVRMQGRDKTAQYISSLEKLGIGQRDALSYARKMYEESAKSGVMYSKYSKEFLSNIQLAQQYSFKNGLDGLSNMAKRSAEIKLNMQEVAKFADKTMTLEGATTAAAGLSVLGGQFAAGSNPLSMLYNSLNDLEGVQKQIESIVTGLAVFDRTSGEFKINPYDRIRLRAASEAMGVNYATMVETAYAKGREGLIGTQLRANGIGKDNELYQYIINKSYMEKGQAKIDVKGKDYTVSQLLGNDEAMKELRKQSRLTDNDETFRTIASSMMTIEETLTGLGNEIKVQRAGKTLKYREAVIDSLNTIGKHASLIADIYTILKIATALGGVFGMAKGVGNMGLGVVRGGRGLRKTAMASRGGAGGVFGGRVDVAGKAGEIYKGNAAKSFGFGFKAGGKGVLNSANRAANRAFWGSTGFAGKAGMVTSTLGASAMGGLTGFLIGDSLGSLAERRINKGSEDKIGSGNIEDVKEGVSQKNKGSLARSALGGIGTAIGIGMALGGLPGALIGAAVGTAGGLKYYFNDRKKNRIEGLRSIISSNVYPIQGEYTEDELKLMGSGYAKLSQNHELIDKIKKQENITDDSILRQFFSKNIDGIEKFRNGGIVKGAGTGESDSNVAMVSNNEYIMPAKETLKPNNRFILDSMRNGNTMIPTSLSNSASNSVNIQNIGDNENSVKNLLSSISKNVTSINTSTIGGNMNTVIRNMRSIGGSYYNSSEIDQNNIGIGNGYSVNPIGGYGISDIRPSQNTLNIEKVVDKERDSIERIVNSINKVGGKVSVDPIRIDGTIRLDGGSSIKDIDASKLLDNPIFVKNLVGIVQKAINRQQNFGFDKKSFPEKF